MKSLVIFYSQTGNTKIIAQAIRDGIEAVTGQCDLKHIRDAKPEDWLDYDLVGVGCPIWGACPTTNLLCHIGDLPPEAAGTHSFFFCTHGTGPGRCILRGVEPMLKKGLTVLGWKDWYASASLHGHAKPWYTDGHPDDMDLQEAKAFGTAMANHSLQVAGGSTALIPALPSPEASDEIYGEDMIVGMLKMMKDGPGGPGGMPGGPMPEPEEDPHPPKYPTAMAYVMGLEGLKAGPNPNNGNLRVDKDRCIGCGRCARACFCENIDASQTPPRFLSQNCEHCLFCESVCPTGAILYDAQPVTPGSPQSPGGRMQQEIAIAEAKGRFRRIIPEHEVGWDTPWEKATTHPRIKDIP